MEMMICSNSREIILFSQLLKIPSLERVDKHKMANGDRMINTLIKIYRYAKLIMSAKEENDNIPRQYTI